MRRLDKLIDDYFERLRLEFKNRNKHSKYGNVLSRPKRGRGRGFTEPFLLKCKRKFLKGRGISGCYFNKRKNHYEFYSYHDSFYRTQASKAIRRLDKKEIISNGSMYKKIYPYQCMCW